MAVPLDISSSFRLYITHVDSEGHFLKISGQLDQQSSLMVESLFDIARENLENGIGAVSPGAIHEGVICAAKYKDGTYYRAKIINVTNLSTGLVGVHFIDYGNKDIISLSTIRFLDSYDPMFLQLRGQATDYYLSRVMHPSGRWEEPLILKLQSLLCNAEYLTTVEAQTRTLPIISIQFKGNDLSSHLVSNRFGIAIPVQKQEVLLMQLTGEIQQTSNWQSNLGHDLPYTEHVPFLYNQNFPSNPASAMRLQQNVALPFNGSIPPPSMISQRLLVNKVPRTPVTLKAPIRQPNLPPTSQPPPTIAAAPSPASNKPPSPKKSITYKSRLLEVNSQHKVFVSFAEEGPELFAVQLVTDAKKLQDMMDDINRRPHSSLAEPPMIGTVCLGRMSGDRIICRAIVMNLSGGECKLFFVDFGDTEMVSYYDIFDIPEEFVKPNVFAMRFCLSGVKKLEKGPHLNETFKQIVNGKVLTLRVVPPEGPPLIQYGELFIDGKNVLDILMANMKDKLQFKWMEMLSLGSRKSVLVSYVDCCIKFYVQLSDKIDELNNVMEAVKHHCENSTSPGVIPVGTACCAKFPDDGKWYRTRVREMKRNNRVVVDYVDYGNEQEVDVSDLRTITPELLKLPAQAMKCALKGYESKPIESKTSNQLEMLALEKTLMAHIVGVISNDTMLVSLIDDTVSPPLDIARRMTQLSAPRSNVEPVSRVPQTPVHKDAPESFSSPEGSEDSRKKSFRREKSFKDERRPPREGNDEFGQRGGSFRNRDNKDSFDRSGPGRHSEKFAGRPDKGDRRGGKPWENNGPSAAQPPISVSDDVWEDSPSTATSAPAFQSRQNRDNARRKSRPDQEKGQKPNWKSRDATGVGKRLRQAAEAAAESQSHASAHKTSIQDRLKRDGRFNNNNQQDDWSEKKEGWGNKGARDNRPDRRDNRGDRRDNWGDKKEYTQKREFRDNNRERGDRPRSNYTPRDRAERSFGSDGDKRSEKSFKSQDSEGRAGRAPPYKTRSKFTHVQYKELSDPVPLETPFQTPVIEPNAQHEVAVTWITSPDSFYTQLLSVQTKFLEMMHSIPDLYKGVKSYTGIVPVGASVLARFPIDGVLYRATVIAVQPGSKFIVQYVDFGNKQVVDAKDIWQLDRQLLELPITAVHCSLLGVMPQDGEWKSSEVDLCFNAPRYQCVYQDCVESGQWKVSLWINGVSVADMLVEKQLAMLSENQSSVALKDEAIDLTIIVGQQILCKVTHVESYDKFYIQLDLEKAARVESAIESYDTSKLTPLAADSLASGIHTTVKHDGKIYRAILNDVTDVENIQAVLPDYGMTITTSLANLMILPTELSVYYYQSLLCSLNNYTAESKTLMTVDELKEKLNGNKFIVYINRVEEITLISTLYDVSTGEKVAIFEPDEGAYEEVVPLCERAIFNYNFGNAYISHAENLNKLYLQNATDSDRLAALLDELYKFYEEGSPEGLESFEVDGLCTAKSSDGNWYRAIIIEVQDNDLKVQFCDYGNTEVVPKESVKKLDPKFHEPCALAVSVSLGLVALQSDAVDKLVEWTTDKEVQVTLAFGTDGWLATLHLDVVDLSMKLVNEKLATPQLSSEIEVEPEQPAPEPLSLPEGCTHASVYISHIDTPGHFWLQMVDKVDKIEEIQAELQTDAASYPEIENRDMSTICVAKYLADDQWYRAEILDSDSDITTVRFIDYGNTDVLDNQPGLIKVIPDHLKEIERYALKSSVNAVPTGTGEWSEPASECFTQLVGDLADPVDAVIVLKDVIMYVDVYVNGQNITDKLVSEGYATRSEENECGDLPSCFASHINSPSEFWIQLETATPELQAMEAAMVDAENFPELTEKEEGVICAAKYPEDDAWYRAQVIVNGSEGTEVLFMDYGNASISNELRSLPDELKVKPALSRKCALQKPRDIKSWSRKSELKFNELAAEGATIFNVQFIASGDISIVELYLEGKSVTEELVGLCEEHTVSERPTPVGQGKHATGKVCYVNSLEELYVQLDNNTSDLDKIFDQISKAADFESVSELKVGAICAAFWDEDGQWYRAKVFEFCDEGYHVLFIDYGNKAKCSEFRELPAELVQIEPIAKCCRLSGTGEDSAQDEAIKEKLDELAAIESTTFEIEFLDSNIEPALVKLVVNGKDIRSLVSSSVESVKVVTEEQASFEEPAAAAEEPAIAKDSIVADETAKSETKHEDQEITTEPSEVPLDSEPTITENTVPENEETQEISEAEQLNTSQPDLNESVESSNTVIENKSFEAKPDSLDDDVIDETPVTPNKDDTSIDTLENSKDTIQTPERDISKDSLNSDTGYTSDQEKSNKDGIESIEMSPAKDLESPEKDILKQEAELPNDETDSSVSEDSPKKYTSDHDKSNNDDIESIEMSPAKDLESPEKDIPKQETELPIDETASSVSEDSPKKLTEIPNNESKSLEKTQEPSKESNHEQGDVNVESKEKYVVTVE